MKGPTLWRELSFDRNYLVIVKNLSVESNVHDESPKETVICKSLKTVIKSSHFIIFMF